MSVSVIGYVIDGLPNAKHRLRLTVNLSSPTDIDQCVGFTLDERFGGRRLETLDGQCPRPRTGTTKIGLTFDKLTSDDLAFPEHTVVWGVPGGRCGFVLEAFGVCVVEQTGTAGLKLPSRNALPMIARSARSARSCRSIRSRPELVAGRPVRQTCVPAGPPPRSRR